MDRPHPSSTVSQVGCPLFFERLRSGSLGRKIDLIGGEERASQAAGVSLGSGAWGLGGRRKEESPHRALQRHSQAQGPTRRKQRSPDLSRGQTHAKQVGGTSPESSTHLPTARCPCCVHTQSPLPRHLQGRPRGTRIGAAYFQASAPTPDPPTTEALWRLHPGSPPRPATGPEAGGKWAQDQACSLKPM